MTKKNGYRSTMAPGVFTQIQESILAESTQNSINARRIKTTGQDYQDIDITKGAVFIPAAGYAQGGILTAREDVSSVSSMGPYVEGRSFFYYTNNPAYPFNWMIYWTSTGGTAASQAKVMKLCYRSAGSNSSPTYSYTEADRSLQRSVRLVQEVQN